MKIEIIKDNIGQAIGWKIIPESREDQKTLGTIRNLSFWGFDETKITYNGIKASEIKVDGKQVLVVDEISWIQKQYNSNGK